MERTRVEDSTNVAAIGYDPINCILQVEFISKGKSEKENWVYTYTHVPSELADAFFAATSKGEFHAAHIRNNPAYPFLKKKRSEEDAERLQATRERLRVIIEEAKAEGITPNVREDYHACHALIRTLEGNDMPTFIGNAVSL